MISYPPLPFNYYLATKSKCLFKASFLYSLHHPPSMEDYFIFNLHCKFKALGEATPPLPPLLPYHHPQSRIQRDREPWKNVTRHRQTESHERTLLDTDREPWKNVTTRDRWRDRWTERQTYRETNRTWEKKVGGLYTLQVNWQNQVYNIQSIFLVYPLTLLATLLEELKHLFLSVKQHEFIHITPTLLPIPFYRDVFIWDHWKVIQTQLRRVKKTIFPLLPF